MSLILKNVSKKYGNKTVVNNISFGLEKPGVFGLLGTNGAGKTTTIRMLLGILKTNSGEITWKGKAVNRKEVNFGYLPEERGVYPKVKIVDQLVYFAELKGMSKEDALKSIDKWSKVLKVEEYLGMPAEKLSKGNQQKIQFLTAIIHDPELVVLDEPFSGLDPVNTEILKSVMEELISRMKNSKVSFLGPKILEHGNIIKGWKTPSYLYELLSTMNYFHKYAKKLITYKDSYYKDGLNEVDVIHGCFFIGRLKDFKKINFFDTNTFLYYEENILSYKAKKNNLGIYVDTSISVIHNLSLSVDKSLNKLKNYKILKDSMFYYETRYRKINIFKYILLRIVYYISYMVGFVTFWV